MILVPSEAREPCTLKPYEAFTHRCQTAALLFARGIAAKTYDVRREDDRIRKGFLAALGILTSMGTRRKSRELCLQMLFQWDMGKQTPDHVRRTFWAEREEADGETRGFADDLFRLAVERQQEIDDLIQKHAQHWRMERMAAVDRNVLRTGVAEFLGYRDTPRPVVINEALEIARKFSAPESVQFINGVLDSVGKELGESRESTRIHTN